MAMLVPPPGLFSITTCCPSRSESKGLRIRASRSVVPPAVNATTSLTGRVGWVWANAVRETKGTAAASPARPRTWRRGNFRMNLSPSFRDGAKRRTRNPDVYSEPASGFRVRELCSRPGMTQKLFRRGLALALRQAAAEVRQNLLGDRVHVGPRHGVVHGAELGLRQRRVEAGEVLIFGELLAHRARAADDNDAIADEIVERLRLAGDLGGADALH